MTHITYHWFPPGADLFSLVRMDGVEGPVIYEYACGQLGSPYHGPHQMHHLLRGQLLETNCPACKRVWDRVPSSRTTPRELQLKYFKEVTERRTLVTFYSAERLSEHSGEVQAG